MTAESDLIEQIVANVLAELQPPPASPVRAPSPPTIVSPVVKSSPLVIDLDVPVVTANLLAERLRGSQAVRIGRRSVITPSARDWLASKKISWTRGTGNASTEPSATARWQLVLTTVTPAITTLRPTLTGWKSELLGTPKEAADHSLRVICTGEADGVLGLCGSAETVACLANRNPKIRAAVLNTALELPALVEHLGPNLLVINPRGKSFVELRNLVRAVETLAKPQAPQGM